MNQENSCIRNVLKPTHTHTRRKLWNNKKGKKLENERKCSLMLGSRARNYIGQTNSNNNNNNGDDDDDICINVFICARWIDSLLNKSEKSCIFCFCPIFVVCTYLPFEKSFFFGFGWYSLSEAEQTKTRFNGLLTSSVWKSSSNLQGMVSSLAIPCVPI